MPQSRTPKHGAILTAVLVVAIGGCKGGEAVGPESKVEMIDVTPKSARMYVLGDSTKFSAAITTEAGTPGAGIEVGWVARDKSLLSVSSAGVAKSLRRGGSTYVVATAGGKSDSALVEVPTTPCGTVAATTLAVGQVVTGIGAAGFCAADTPDAEYTAIVFNSALTSSATAGFEIIGSALAAPPTTNGAALASRAAFMRPTGLLIAPPTRDVRAESRFRESERVTLSPLVASAQRWYGDRSRAARRNAAPPVVGDLINLNVNMGATCSSITLRNARVTAVSNTAVMLEDVNNPAGGFADTTYARMAATFDTLLNPVSVGAFGDPTDLDGNARVLILFTRAINELTPVGSTDYVGLAMSRDLFPRTGTGSTTQPQGCAASNVGEIFYMLAPDPTAAVNGNPMFTTALVESQTLATLGHEYQHLINFSRRIYLLGLTSDKWFEEVWLHEGLSHMAEELFYHRAGGFPPRSNTGLSQLLANDVPLDAFNEYMIGDFFLYDSYAENTKSTSPFNQGDKVSTRGATWSFLRYAADQTRPTDGNLWYQLVNSGLIGQANLQQALGVNAAGFQAMLRDFAVSVYGDDYVPGLQAKYTQPSWNMRSIYPGFCDRSPCTFFYPLAPEFLQDNAQIAGTVVAGGFGVYRFRAVRGAEGFVRVTGAAGGPMPTSLNTTIIRTK